jgi:hypothetical protein
MKQNSQSWENNNKKININKNIKDQTWLKNKWKKVIKD